MTNQNKIPCINATKNDSKNAVSITGRLAFILALLFFVFFVPPLSAKKPPKKSTQTTQTTQDSQTPKITQESAENDAKSATQDAESSEQKSSEKKADEKSIQSQPCNELCEYIRQKTSTTKHKNGYFIGVNGGANVLYMYNKLVWLPTFGLSFGVNSFFTPYIGVRGYVSADVGFGDYEGVLGMLSLGIEALAEFSLNKRKSVFLGGFLGFGVDGYVYYDKRDFSSFSTMQKNGGFYMQGGISFAFLRHNRLNIATRFIPARSVQNFSSAVLAYGQYSYTF
ncbi:hypothetical protein [Helicobacter macacae]|uniref:Outer membrane protein beta-barrel domain-containing protein n=1 Tax=Helicobacter macacae MIT 99-5501 TaxID=1357400 RepID=V8CD80_9HELI|nr:hypothetical protein [Helicobacter macacae]ETD24681.1 hypothetical protein HMPREF2086_00013 [Helicobacter macacae MIT 99-5501]